MLWPRAAAWDLSRMTFSSNWARRTSTPLPLATMSFPKRLLKLSAGFAAVGALVEAGLSGAAPKTGRDATMSSRTEDSIVLFIFRSEEAVETIRRLRRRGGIGGSRFVRRRAQNWEGRHHEQQDGGLDRSIHIQIGRGC